LAGDDSENQIRSIVEGTGRAFMGKPCRDVTLHIMSLLCCFGLFHLVRS
jgi:hypothetical protein